MFGSGCFGYGSVSFYGISPFIMIIPMVIFWGVLIYLIYKLFNHDKNTSYQNSISSAINILNERFARGEISEEEYAIKKKQLRK